MRETVTLITEIFIGISCMVVAILGWAKAEELIADSRQKLWREYFWSQSFCLLTTGGASIEVIKKYIESQGEKH